MKESTKHLVLSELHTAFAYFDRIAHALVEITKQHGTTKTKEIMDKFTTNLHDYLKTYLLKDTFEGTTDFNSYDFHAHREQVREMKNLMSALLMLSFNDQASIKIALGTINTFYRYCHELHTYISNHSAITIDYPRTVIASALDAEAIQGKISKFFIKLEDMERLEHTTLPSITAIEVQRTKRFEDFIHKGHIAIYNKKFEEAAHFFEKARNLKDCAEAINLLGWTHSLLGDNNTAKNYAIKAIEKDSDYGPAYNDLGTYLLAEGAILESIKWFELAKKASVYPNREYPYINAGRAYLALENFNKALNEFSIALTLNPENKELSQTVTKLRNSLKPRAPQEPQFL